MKLFDSLIEQIRQSSNYDMHGTVNDLTIYTTGNPEYGVVAFTVWYEGQDLTLVIYSDGTLESRANRLSVENAVYVQMMLQSEMTIVLEPNSYEYKIDLYQFG